MRTLLVIAALFASICALPFAQADPIYAPPSEPDPEAWDAWIEDTSGADVQKCTGSMGFSTGGSLSHRVDVAGMVCVGTDLEDLYVGLSDDTDPDCEQDVIGESP